MLHWVAASIPDYYLRGGSSRRSPTPWHAVQLCKCTAEAPEHHQQTSGSGFKNQEEVM